jgi:predicted flap endonuclease-1-like 5' DNA nuclease
MSLVYQMIYGNLCKSTHHKLAFDALSHQQGPAPDAWQNQFLQNYRRYLDGAKAPDTQFRDFKNHVLHVRENNWGGAMTAANDWFQKAVLEFQRQNWEAGIFNTGVLTHYVSDPFMPFHTGQTEAEGVVHRACEWSITCSYDVIKTILDQEQGGVPKIKTSNSPQWLGELITQGANHANKFYFELIQRYDLSKGSKTPTAGLDDVSRRMLATLIGECIATISVVLDRLFAQVAMTPAVEMPTLQELLSQETISASWIKKNITDQEERQAALNTLDEVSTRGKAVQSLSLECQEVRRLHTEQVLKTSLSQLDQQAIEMPGQAYGKAASGQFMAQNRSTSLPQISIPPDVNEFVYQRSQRGSMAGKTASLITKKIQRPQAYASLRGGWSQPPVITPPYIPVKEVSQLNTKMQIHETDHISPTREPRQPPHDNHIATTDSVEARRERRRLRYENETPEERRLRKRRILKQRRAQEAAKRQSTQPDASISSTTLQTLSSESSAPRQQLAPRLRMDSELVDAPSIGPKTADRFRTHGILTVADFLKADAADMADKLQVGHIRKETIQAWQDQCRLVTQIPKLRGMDAQFLVAMEVCNLEQLSQQEPTKLHRSVLDFLQTKEGQRMARDSKPPLLENVRIWIDWSRTINSTSDNHDFGQGIQVHSN